MWMTSGAQRLRGKQNTNFSGHREDDMGNHVDLSASSISSSGSGGQRGNVGRSVMNNVNGNSLNMTSGRRESNPVSLSQCEEAPVQNQSMAAQDPTRNGYSAPLLHAPRHGIFNSHVGPLGQKRAREQAERQSQMQEEQQKQEILSHLQSQSQQSQQTALEMLLRQANESRSGNADNGSLQHNLSSLLGANIGQNSQQNDADYWNKIASSAVRMSDARETAEALLQQQRQQSMHANVLQQLSQQQMQLDLLRSVSSNGGGASNFEQSNSSSLQDLGSQLKWAQQVLNSQQEQKMPSSLTEILELKRQLDGANQPNLNQLLGQLNELQNNPPRSQHQTSVSELLDMRRQVESFAPSNISNLQQQLGQMGDMHSSLRHQQPQERHPQGTVAELLELRKHMENMSQHGGGGHGDGLSQMRQYDNSHDSHQKALFNLLSADRQSNDNSGALASLLAERNHMNSQLQNMESFKSQFPPNMGQEGESGGSASGLPLFQTQKEELMSRQEDLIKSALLKNQMSSQLGSIGLLNNNSGRRPPSHPLQGDDSLRYFNNGVEVDAAGHQISEHASSVMNLPSQQISARNDISSRSTSPAPSVLPPDCTTKELIVYISEKVPECLSLEFLMFCQEKSQANDQGFLEILARVLTQLYTLVQNSGGDGSSGDENLHSRASECIHAVESFVRGIDSNSPVMAGPSIKEKQPDRVEEKVEIDPSPPCTLSSSIPPIKKEPDTDTSDSGKRSKMASTLTTAQHQFFKKEALENLMSPNLPSTTSANLQSATNKEEEKIVKTKKNNSPPAQPIQAITTKKLTHPSPPTISHKSHSLSPKTSPAASKERPASPIQKCVLPAQTSSTLQIVSKPRSKGPHSDLLGEIFGSTSGKNYLKPGSTHLKCPAPAPVPKPDKPLSYCLPSVSSPSKKESAGASKKRPLPSGPNAIKAKESIVSSSLASLIPASAFVKRQKNGTKITGEYISKTSTAPGSISFITMNMPVPATQYSLGGRNHVPFGGQVSKNPKLLGGLSSSAISNGELIKPTNPMESTKLVEPAKADRPAKPTTKTAKISKTAKTAKVAKAAKSAKSAKAIKLTKPIKSAKSAKTAKSAKSPKSSKPSKSSKSSKSKSNKSTKSSKSDKPDKLSLSGEKNKSSKSKTKSATLSGSKKIEISNIKNSLVPASGKKIQSKPKPGTGFTNGSTSTTDKKASIMTGSKKICGPNDGICAKNGKLDSGISNKPGNNESEIDAARALMQFLG